MKSGTDPLNLNISQ